MTAINDVVDLSLEDGVAVVTLDSPPVNALSPALMEGIYDAMTAALADPAAKAVVLICAGRTFIAGADLKSLGKVEPKVDFFELQDAIENSPKPTIAAMHGTALGGGLELALTFHYRIAVPSARMGLPEVTLGLLPGGGGTQRMPRITGAEAALDLMITGRQIAAPEALKIGLVDRLADEAGLRGDALIFARDLVVAGDAPKRIRDQHDKIARDRNNPDIFDRFRVDHAKLLTGLDAPQAIVRCVEAAVAGPWEAGIAVERAEFQRVLKGPQSAALRHVFMAERTAQKIPDLSRDAMPLTIDRVGVVGAGTMGGGIATAFLGAGFPVTLIEREQATLDRGVAAIKGVFTSRVGRGKLTPEKAEAGLAGLTPSLDLADLADVDLVIEAVFETLAVKTELFTRLDGIVRPDTILATNTSYLDVNAIAAATNSPERVLGLHFFSPAHVMRLLEVVRGDRTSDAVLATAMRLGKTLGKATVVARVCHGFIGNRMLAVRQAEAYRMVAEGVAPWEIDRVLTDFGLPMGPFAMMDLAGLDLGWEGETDTIEGRLCAIGRRGQKTGAGFYDYADRKAAPSQVTLDIIRAVTGVTPGSLKLDDVTILARLTAPLINEGARILEEGIAVRGSDVDLVWIAGYGWPAHKGGPMFHADVLGLSTVIDDLTRWTDVEPAALLRSLADSGGSLASWSSPA